MIVLYNVLQLLLSPLLVPVLLLTALLRARYRRRTPSRLGWGMAAALPAAKPDQLTFWVHALSVGETTSAIPLLKGLRTSWPDCRIIFSVTTRSGRRVADDTLPGLVDAIIDSPFDLLPVVLYFCNAIRPDCYLLVETDFWPNLLHVLRRRGVPSLLVNGRVSDEALAGYRKLAFFFSPMFHELSALALQTAADRDKLKALGLPRARLHTLGNLKFDTTPRREDAAVLQQLQALLPAERTVLIAGSTHPGEEEILLSAWQELKREFPELLLIIAPRNIERAAELQKLCARFGFMAVRRSDNQPVEEVLLLNTIGELAACYSLGQLAFVGGSLIKEGGHNPIEPALAGLPVFFGPSMEDFSEIASDLQQAGGAVTVANADAVVETLRPLLSKPARRLAMGEAAHSWVIQQQGVIERHLELIQTLLAQETAR